MSMHADEESDEGIVPMKRSNKEDLPSAETVEGRASPEENGGQATAVRTPSRVTASNRLAAVRQAARQSRDVRFTALLHHITIDLLKQSYIALERDAAPGIDGVTWRTYGENLEAKLKDLHERIHKGSYRARPARRTYIPKADGSKRPLSIWCLEDKIVQQAVVRVLEAIYEEDFVGFSYGFRPGRGQHDALDALHAGILRRRVNWVLDADIQGFFDAMSHIWIRRFLEHRIADKRILRLITKWLKVGVVEDGRVTRSGRGAPQGAVISPILANVYLHYVYDLWVHRWRRTKVTGDVVVVRYADDTIVGFEHEHEARAFLHETDGPVRSHLAPGENPADPLRSPCGQAACGAWREETRGIRLPRLHALLHAITQMGLVRYWAQDDQEANVRKAGGGQDGVAQTNARHHRQNRHVGMADAQRASELLRSTRQRQEPLVVLQRGALALVEVAEATQPDRPSRVGAVHPPHQPLLSADPRKTPYAMSPLRRHNPREEPGALAAHAGICAGGGRQRPSLPRPCNCSELHATHVCPPDTAGYPQDHDTSGSVWGCFAGPLHLGGLGPPGEIISEANK
jgi:retron-type reverse transcriptase